MGLIITGVFILGYLFIVFEHNIKISKSATSLLTGVLCWVVYICLTADTALVLSELKNSLGSISEIVFFLLGAMTIVELIDAHNGFSVITNLITTTERRKLLWILGITSFFLSAVLDNLTTAIVMVSLTRKLTANNKDRLMLAGIIIIAANAGGAWSPIGDVTTTMLWIANKVSASGIIKALFLPSVICLIIPIILLSLSFKGNTERPEITKLENRFSTTNRERNIVFLCGLLSLLFVPVFKTITHLPPYMGVLFGLSVLWVVTELLHKPSINEEKTGFTVASALQKIDVPSVLFFLGILLAISVLEATHLLKSIAVALDNAIGNQSLIVILIGLFSAVVDNVPLVAASMGMYDFHTDHTFWSFIAYCAGTGGSILVIGSAAGVAAMGIEKIDFIWYLKKISWLALAGYLGGALTYLALNVGV